jgi:hypothetical protein
MIKIRYRDPNELSPGLFAAAESHGRGTTVYLLSGLTSAERHVALRRLRLSARMGHGIRLPAAQLGLALVADWVRTGIGRAGAVFRSHPAGSTVPVMAVSAGAIAFLLLSAVSIRGLPTPALNQLPPSSPAPSVSAVAEPVSNVPPTPGAGGLGPRDIGTTTRGQIGTDRWTVFSPPSIGSFGTGSLPGGGSADGSGTTSAGAGATNGGGTGSGSTGTGTGSGGGTPVPTPTPTPTPTPSMTSPPIPSPSPSPLPSATPTPTPTPTPTATSTQSPTPSTGTVGDGNCLDAGPVTGVCRDV